MTVDYRDLAVTCHPAAALSCVVFYCHSGLARPQVLTLDPAGISFSISVRKVDQELIVLWNELQIVLLTLPWRSTSLPVLCHGSLVLLSGITATYWCGLMGSMNKKYIVCSWDIHPPKGKDLEAFMLEKVLSRGVRIGNCPITFHIKVCYFLFADDHEEESTPPP